MSVLAKSLYEEGKEIAIVARMPRRQSDCDYVFLAPMGILLRDAVLYQRILVQSGILEFPPEGALMHCIVEKAPKGPCVVRVLRVERKIHVEFAEVAIFGPEPMTVKFFLREAGYGFFTRSDGIDVFVYHTVLDAGHIKWEAMAEGAIFKVSYRPSPKGFHATKVSL